MRRLKKKKREVDPSQFRINFISSVFVLMGFFIVARLFFLQVIEYPWYNALASGQHEIFEQLIPKRGEIFAEIDGNLYPLVVNKNTYIVYVIPRDIEDAERTADLLLPWLKEMKLRAKPENEEQRGKSTDQLDQEVTGSSDEESENNSQDITEDKERLLLLEILTKKDDPYEPLIKGVSKDDIKILKNLALPGVHWLPEAARYYPEENIGSHIYGFFSFLSDTKKGQYGIEGYWDEFLRGREGILRGEKDATGYEISIAPRTLHKAINGVDLVLTINPAIQYTACVKLREYIEKFSAVGGSVVILNPNNGEVVAMCSYPDFDPNHYNRVKSIDVFINPAISSAYEPGSVMKPITMAAGLDAGLVEPDSTYYDEGKVKIGGFTIRNSDLKSHGTQTMTEILEKSLNTGAIYVAEQLGEKLFKDYFKKFGFGQKTGIKLSGEVSGNIRPLDKKGFIYTATASYGQGITVTPLQMAAAYIPIANGGTMYKTHIVKKIIYPNGNIEVVKPEIVEKVISSKTSALLSGMLVSVIKNGHAKRAAVKGYLLAGKTGTANIAGPDGRYLAKETIHTFVGFGPVNKPKFVILTKLDKPKINYSSASAAPLFSEIASFILKYYHVPPTEGK